MVITPNQLNKYTHVIMEGTQAILLSSLVTLFYTFINVEVMGFTAGTLLILLFFITIDFITGVSYSIKNGERVTSKKGRETVYKFTGYVMVILLLAVVEIFVKSESGITFGSITISFIRHFIFSLMLFWEFHSVGENIDKIFGKKPRIFYFVEVTTLMLEKRLMKGLENILKIEEEKDEKAITESSSKDISET